MNKGSLVISISEKLNYIDAKNPAIIIKDAYGVVITKESRWDGVPTFSEETKVVDILYHGKVYTRVPIKYLKTIKSK